MNQCAIDRGRIKTCLTTKMCDRFVYSNEHAKKVTRQFLLLYRSLRFLWDQSHKLYNDKSERLKAYKKLLEKLKEINPDATLTHVRFKIAHMRSAYRRDCKKVIASRLKGDDPPYTPTLWYYDHLKFLDEETAVSCDVEASYLESASDVEEVANNPDAEETRTAISYISENKQPRQTDMSVNSDRVKQTMTEVLLAYKAKRFLWDPKHKLYLKKIQRTKAFNKILEIYKQIDRDATIADLKYKIDNLKVAYHREHKKVLDSRMSDLETPYVPKIWYYNLLSFLHYDSEQIDDMAESNSDNDVYVDEEFLIDESDTKHEMKSEFLNQPKGSLDLTQSAQSVMSESISFGTTVGLQLEQLDPVQKVIAEKLISDVIFQGRLKMLSTSTCIVNSDDINRIGCLESG